MSDASSEAANELLVELTAEIVAAYVSNHVVPVAELASMIGDVHTALSGTGNPAPARWPWRSRSRRSRCASRFRTTTDHLSECGGGGFKSLKRHLMTHHSVTPKNIAKSGISPPIIRWWRRPMPRLARAFQGNGPGTAPQARTTAAQSKHSKTK